MGLHRCNDTSCHYFDQPSPGACGCHQSDEQVLRTRNAELTAAIEAILNEETVSVHVGYENDMTSQAYVYADAVRTDSDAFVNARRLITKATSV